MSMPKPTLPILLTTLALGSLPGCARTGPSLNAESFGTQQTTLPRSDRPRGTRPTPIEQLEIVSIAPTRPLGTGVKQAGAIGAQSVEAGPPTIDPNAEATGQAVHVDGKVGDVNGQAVFARAFFRQQQLEGRLRAEAQKYGEGNRQAFRDAAALIIVQAVQDFVKNEIIYRERRFSLSESEERSLRHALRLLEERLSGNNRGSRTQADRNLQEEQGLTTDEYIDKVERDELIRDQINQAIAGYDEPSQHEVRTYYLNNQDIYNPDPLATVRMIWVPADDIDGVEKIESRLNAGEGFATVASDTSNRFNRSGGGLLSDEPIEFKEPLSEAVLTPIEPLNDALTSLEPGQWAGPVGFATSSGREQLGYVYLESIENLRIPFLDAQLYIYNALRQQKRRVATHRYFLRLLGDASYTGIEDMTLRLVRIAEETYLGPVPGEG